MTATTMSPLVEREFRASWKPEVLIDNMLTESSGLTTMSILEESKGSGVLIVEGKVGQCDLPTANKRLYERKIMEREISKLQEKIDRSAALAAVDHPNDGRSRIREAGAICRGLRVERDGSIIGKYEIVEDSTGGRDLAAFLRRGCAIGMSSRGLGSTRIDGSGNYVVGEDFRLHGFDFVADPACRDAFPGLVSEDIDPDTVTENELRVRFPSLVENIEKRAREIGAEVIREDALAVAKEQLAEENNKLLAETHGRLREEIKQEIYAECRQTLRDDFAAKLLKSIKEAKEEALEIARSELLSDPKVAGAKKFVESLAQDLVPFHPDPSRQSLMDNLESQIKDLQKKLDEHQASVKKSEDDKKLAEDQARRFGKQLYVERSLRGYDQIDEMVKMVGDVEQFPTVEALQNHVRSIVKQINETEKQANARAVEKVKITEHKAALASTKAERLEEQLEHVRTELADKIEEMRNSFQRELDEKNSLISEAAEAIETLETELKSAKSKAVDAELMSYTIKRVQGHPRAEDIITAVSSGRVTSKENVRTLAEQWDTRGQEPGGASERIRRSLGRGRESQPEEMESITEDRRTIPGLDGLDTTMGELKRLAGVGQTENRRRRF